MQEINAKATITGKELLEAMKVRFDDESELLNMKRGLRNIMQCKVESVVEFSERILKLYKLASPQESQQENCVQSRLIKSFVNGLIKHSIRRCLIAQDLQTFRSAVEIAKSESRIDFQLSLHDSEDKINGISVVNINDQKQKFDKMMHKMRQVATFMPVISALESRSPSLSTDRAARTYGRTMSFS